ncbi:hypothetical protein OG21DRAFT_1420305 [Imleria badia]|nr:hypothetical protein OG21DRAFT_1420305 [Imleria badia]
MIWTTRLISLLALAASLPISEAKNLDVWVPTIKIPNRETVWSLKNPPYLVEDTSNHPSEITNSKGQVLLVHDNRLDYGRPPDHPLAEGFDILDGQVKVHLPASTKPGKYEIVLMGDSGNDSSEFTIVE